MNFLILFLLIIILIITLGVWRTWQIQSDLRQKMFLNGIVPNPLPDGFYNGTVSGQKSSWLGKKFDSKNATGINVFNSGFELKNERHPFITYQGKGLLDKSSDVLKIDYNIKDNPFWLKFIVDEIVQIEKDKYLGKMVLRIIPGFPFSVLYFEITK